MNIPDKLSYTKEHEWCRVDGDVVTVGITDFAQSELGDVVFLELPEVDGTTTASEEFGTIEAVKAVAELYAPISGTIVEVNQDLVDSPETINADPYGDGWMIKIAVKDPSALEGLLDAAAYKELIGEGGE